MGPDGARMPRECIELKSLTSGTSSLKRSVNNSLVTSELGQNFMLWTTSATLEKLNRVVRHTEDSSLLRDHFY